MVASIVRPTPLSRSPPTPPRAELGFANPILAIVEGDPDAIRRVRVFVSSPGDTIHERGRVDRVVERLNGEFAGTARLETIRWETEFYRADTGFQPQIPEAAECDIVIAVFRHRIGTELPSTFAPSAGRQSLPERHRLRSAFGDRGLSPSGPSRGLCVPRPRSADGSAGRPGGRGDAGAVGTPEGVLGDLVC